MEPCTVKFAFATHTGIALKIEKNWVRAMWTGCERPRWLRRVWSSAEFNSTRHACVLLNSTRDSEVM